MPPRTEAQIAELKRLRDETLALLEWFEHREPATIWAEMRALVTNAEGSLPKMRAVAREVRSLVGEMPPDLREATLASVEGDTGVSLTASDAADAKKAETLFLRGRVVSDSEYYLLRSHLERVSNEPGREADVAQIMTILDGYSPSRRAAT